MLASFVMGKKSARPSDKWAWGIWVHCLDYTLRAQCSSDECYHGKMYTIPYLWLNFKAGLRKNNFWPHDKSKFCIWIYYTLFQIFNVLCLATEVNQNFHHIENISDISVLSDRIVLVSKHVGLQESRSCRYGDIKALIYKELGLI